MPVHRDSEETENKEHSYIVLTCITAVVNRFDKNRTLLPDAETGE